MLVVATPCPLILGVPIALMGGVNRAARDKIIVKRLVGLAILAKVSFLMLDKTGTITVGRPELVHVERARGTGPSEDQLLSLTAAVERHSLHPIAKSLVEAAQARSLPSLQVQDVVEVAGQGISATVGKRHVAVHGAAAPYGQMRVISEVDGAPAATLCARRSTEARCATDPRADPEFRSGAGHRHGGSPSCCRARRARTCITTRH